MNIEKLKQIKISTDSKYKDLLKTCYKYAQTNTHHPSTHNGALLVEKGTVILKGKNVLPRGVKLTKSRIAGDNKHTYPNHAERDLIYKAAKKGVKTNGLTMVMPWVPCIPCANCVISSGIKNLIVHKQMVEKTKEGWRKELEDALNILDEAGVKIIAYDGEVGVEAYMHRKKWIA